MTPLKSLGNRGISAVWKEYYRKSFLMEMHQSIGTEKTISNLFKSYGKLHLISILPLSNNFESKRTCQMVFCPSFYVFSKNLAMPVPGYQRCVGYWKRYRKQKSKFAKCHELASFCCNTTLFVFSKPIINLDIIWRQYVHWNWHFPSFCNVNNSQLDLNTIVML